MKITNSFFFLAILLCSYNLNAITKTSVTNGDWNNPSTWNPAVVPLSEDTVVVIHNLFIDKKTEFGASLCWIKTNGSLTGDSVFAVHGNFLNDGLVDINNVIGIGDGNSMINNGTIHGNIFLPANTNNFNAATINVDTVTFTEIFTNSGSITVQWMMCGGTFYNNSGASITATDITNSGNLNNNSGATIIATNIISGDGTFHNYTNAAIAVTASLTIAAAFINDGEVKSFDLTQAATISGTNGKFCIANFFKNAQDSLLGSLDICDATPGQQPFLDYNFGYVANTVTFCSVGPCSTTSSNELNNALVINIYPNPSAGKFNILTIGDIKLFEIEIYNLLGKKVLSQSMHPETNEIDLSKQANGVYFLQLKTDKGTATKKIIIND